VITAIAPTRRELLELIDEQRDQLETAVDLIRSAYHALGYLADYAGSPQADDLETAEVIERMNSRLSGWLTESARLTARADHAVSAP